MTKPTESNSSATPTFGTQESAQENVQPSFGVEHQQMLDQHGADAYDQYAAMTGAPARPLTEQERRNQFLTQLGYLGPAIDTTKEQLQAHPNYESWARNARAAGFDPEQLIQQLSANRADSQGGFARGVGKWMDRTGLDDVVTYGTLAVAGMGAAGGLGFGPFQGGAGAGATGGAAPVASGVTTQPLTAAHASQIAAIPGSALAPVSGVGIGAPFVPANAAFSSAAVPASSASSAGWSKYLDKGKKYAQQIGSFGSEGSEGSDSPSTQTSFPVSRPSQQVPVNAQGRPKQTFPGVARIPITGSAYKQAIKIK